MVTSIFEIEAHPPMLIEVPPFTIQIKEALRSGRAVARYNASVKNDVMGAYWVIID